MPTVLQGAEVYKPRPNYRLIMRTNRDPAKQVVAVSQSRDGLAQIEHDLTNCDYTFVCLEGIEESDRWHAAQAAATPPQSVTLETRTVPFTKENSPADRE